MNHHSTAPVRHAAIVAAALAMSALCAPQAEAQTYPARTMQVVVPFAAGGGVDVATRLVTEKMGAILGQRFVIENRGGGGTIVGTQGVARASGDGYTLLAAPTTLVINPALREAALRLGNGPRPGCDAGKASVRGRRGEHVSGKQHEGARKLGRSQSEPLTFGSGGTGTVAHLAGELFSIQSGAKMQHVPAAVKPHLSPMSLAGVCR